MNHAPAGVVRNISIVTANKRFMGFTFLLAVSLCFDTFAISVACARQCRHFRQKELLKFAVVFATMQSFFALAGWFAGENVVRYISHIDHWIASALLFFVAAKMFIAFLRREEFKFRTTSQKHTFFLAIATSIDALAVGISLPVFQIPLLQFIIVLFLITLFTVFFGVIMGNRLYRIVRLQIGELMGSLILSGLAIKVLLEHLS